MELTLLIPKRQPHVAQDVVDEFQQAILATPDVKAAGHRYHFLADVTWKILRSTPAGRPLRRFFLRHKRHFVVLMTTDFASCVPSFVFSRDNAAYLFDAWPRLHPLIEDALPILNIRTVFVSSQQATEMFKSNPRLQSRFVWMPEGIDVTRYRSRDLHSRDIDVLQLGRKHDGYHAAIVDVLDKAGKTYLYEKVKGQVIFPTRADFIDGLSRSKISICIPSNLTHPERAGNISTMTSRYLQSMASGCLVVGVTPQDMRELFDYEPIVEIDFNDPAGQLMEILNHIDRYRPLIERNARTVREHHTWSHRWDQIQRELARNPESDH